MKTNLKLVAIDLRKKGYLYSEIALELAVAKSTASAWTRDITLTEEQKYKIAERIKVRQAEKIKSMAIINKQLNQKRMVLLRTKLHRL